MTNYLITPTLLNSLKYYLGSEYSKREDFLKTLSREKFEPNEAMQKGIDFENDIENYCNNNFEPSYIKRTITYRYGGGGSLAGDFWYDEDEKEEFFIDNYSQSVINCGNIVKGGFWQESVKKEIKVAGIKFLLYGRCDVIKNDTIFDIKYTKNYNVGKFTDSTQHLIYMYCSGLSKFQYLVSDLKSFWIEEYQSEKNIESKIISEIFSFLDYLDRDSEAKKLFYSKWESKY